MKMVCGQWFVVGRLCRMACVGLIFIFQLSIFNSVQGQTVVGFNVPTSMCEGTSQTVSFGFSPLRNIVIQEIRTTLGHSERIFLPDGVPCGTMGCSYRSHVNFSSFPSDATITSVEDIKYVRLNIEHSWIGDIYIGITCPNDQKASLLKYSNNGSSSCTSTIPMGHRGWDASSTNVGVGTYLGAALSGQDSNNPCDSTAYANRPGIGWNYCWSNNTTSGYSYAHTSASDDGIIYRSGHSHNGKIDSSNVAAMTNFYHPDQNFSSLIGCPLNGDWYIEVLDGWGGDNGYIFEWELALNAEQIQDCLADSFMVSGYGVTMLNDSTFTILAPTGLTHDTTFLYNYHIYSSCGNDFDTTVALTFHPTYHADTTVVACEQFIWHGHRYTSSTHQTYSTTSIYGCDSIEQADITVNPGYHLQHEALVVENDLPYSYRGHTFYDPVTDSVFPDTTVFGCDSTLTLTIHVAYNQFLELIDTVCLSQTPYLWANRQYTASVVDTLFAFTSLGADSVVVLHLTVLPSDDIHLYDTVCFSQGYTFDGITYNETGIYTRYFTNIYGCDSTVTLHLGILRDPIQAEIRAIPLMVTPTSPEVRLYDISHHNSSCRWIIEGQSYSERHLTYTYPVDLDSLPVTLVAVSAEGCTDTTTTVIYIDRATIFTPNVFTPSESTNNTWQPGLNDILSLELWIYNRQGQLLCHLEGADARWDGTSNGAPCPQGAYVYTLLYRSLMRPEKQQKLNGTILLLR